MNEHGYAVRVSGGYEEAVRRTRLALVGEGFSVLTEMNLPVGTHATSRHYLILGAFGPPAAQPESDLVVGVQLPCNVVIQEDGAEAIVATLDPGDEPGISEERAVAARAAIARAFARIADER